MGIGGIQLESTRIGENGRNLAGIDVNQRDLPEIGGNCQDYSAEIDANRCEWKGIGQISATLPRVLFYEGSKFSTDVLGCRE